MCEAQGGFPSGGTDILASLSPSGGFLLTPGRTHKALSSASAHGASLFASVLYRNTKLQVNISLFVKLNGTLR